MHINMLIVHMVRRPPIPVNGLAWQPCVTLWRAPHVALAQPILLRCSDDLFCSCSMHRPPMGAADLSADAHSGMRARCSQLNLMKHFEPWAGMRLRTARPQPAQLIRHCRSPRVRRAGRPTIGIPRCVGCARCARPAANRAPLRLVAGYARPDRRPTSTAASCTRRSGEDSIKCDRERLGAHLWPVALTPRSRTAKAPHRSSPPC